MNSAEVIEQFSNSTAKLPIKQKAIELVMSVDKSGKEDINNVTKDIFAFLKQKTDVLSFQTKRFLENKNKTLEDGLCVALLYKDLLDYSKKTHALQTAFDKITKSYDDPFYVNFYKKEIKRANNTIQSWAKECDKMLEALTPQISQITATSNSDLKQLANATEFLNIARHRVFFSDTFAEKNFAKALLDKKYQLNVSDELIYAHDDIYIDQMYAKAVSGKKPKYRDWTEEQVRNKIKTTLLERAKKAGKEKPYLKRYRQPEKTQ